MSYEEIAREAHPCWCGKGVIVSVEEMDDWNRTRSSQTIECLACRAEDRRRRKEEAKRDALREAARNEAKRLVKARYLAAWLKRFEGLSKKAAWLLLTDQGKSYPSLGTFYSHLKSYSSVEDYLRWDFDQDFKGMMKRAGIKDPEVEDLLRESETG